MKRILMKIENALIRYVKRHGREVFGRDVLPGLFDENEEI